MKKRFIIFSLILCLVLASAPMAYASGLDVVKVTPKDGGKNCQPANMCVKIEFSENMVDGANVQTNQSRFKITDPEGNRQQFTMVYSEKYPNELWLVLDGTLESKTEYTVSIGAGIEAASGKTTAATTTTTFTVIDTSRVSIISTIMMVFMVGLLVLMTSLSGKKQTQEQQVLTVAQAEKLNPYKIAKAKKISLEQAQAIVEKEKEKARKAEAKKLEQKRAMEEIRKAEMAAIEAEVDAEERRNGWFRVKTVGSFTAHGHAVPKYVKKKNEAKRKAEEERAKKYAKNKKKK